MKRNLYQEQLDKPNTMPPVLELLPAIFRKVFPTNHEVLRLAEEYELARNHVQRKWFADHLVTAAKAIHGSPVEGSTPAEIAMYAAIYASYAAANEGFASKMKTEKSKLKYLAFQAMFTRDCQNVCLSEANLAILNGATNVKAVYAFPTKV